MGRERKLVRGDEHGVVLPIVVLSLVAIIGMVVLVVDVGSLLLTRRAMVNTADAAALSAAMSCARTNDTEDPEESADQLAVPNTVGLAPGHGGVVWAETVNCDTGEAGYVTVEYEVPRSLFFVPALGLPNETTVVSKATASWGGAGNTGEGKMPVVIHAGAFQGACDIPHVQPETICTLWFDNSIEPFSPSTFAFLDIDAQWNVPASHNCTSAGGANQLMNWINGTSPAGDTALNDPPPTYVCAFGGLQGNVTAAVWGEITKLKGQIRDFPVNDPATQLMRQGQIDKYNIIGWVRFRIVDVLDVQSSAQSCTVRVTQPTIDLMAVPECFIPADALFLGVDNVNPNRTYQLEGSVITFTEPLPNNGVQVRFSYAGPNQCGVAPNASARCLVLEWPGDSFDAEDPGSGENFGIQGVWLSK
jgi:hypothetical protein